MKKYSLYNKDIDFSLTVDKSSIKEGESFTVTITASGPDAVIGFEVPYRIGGKDSVDLIRVSPYDFNKKEEFGLFKLNENLQDTVTITIVEDIYLETNEVCYVSLLLRPNINVSVLVEDTSIPLPPVPETTPIKDPRITITPLQTYVKEGEVADFHVAYEGIQEGLVFEYIYYDSKSSIEYDNSFTIKPSGFTMISLKVDVQEQTTSSSRILVVTLKDYPAVTARVIIQNTEIVGNTIEGLYNVGAYTLRCPPNISFKVTLVGGGGGAGGSVVYEDRELPNISGSVGDKTEISFSGVPLCIAEGGGGGLSGWWDNGSFWASGGAGIPGGYYIDLTSNYIKRSVTSREGSKGYSQKYLKDGGPSVSTIGNYGEGGERGVGRGNGDDGYSGTGASGSCLEFILRNDSEIYQEFSLIVGGGGIGGESDRTSSKGGKGLDGICIITRGT